MMETLYRLVCVVLIIVFVIRALLHRGQPEEVSSLLWAIGIAVTNQEVLHP